MIGEGEQERVRVDGDFALPFNRIDEHPVGVDDRTFICICTKRRDAIR